MRKLVAVVQVGTVGQLILVYGKQVQVLQTATLVNFILDLTLLGLEGLLDIWKVHQRFLLDSR